MAIEIQLVGTKYLVCSWSIDDVIDITVGCLINYGYIAFSFMNLRPAKAKRYFASRIRVQSIPPEFNGLDKIVPINVALTIRPFILLIIHNSNDHHCKWPNIFAPSL